VSVEEADPAQSCVATVRTAPGRWRHRQGCEVGLWPAVASPLEEGPGARDVAVAAVVGQDAVMADADQANGQDVPTEAADELDGAQSQFFDFGPVAVIPVSEGDGLAWLVQSHDAAVADGHAVSVVGQIGQDLFRAAQGTFGIDVPALSIQVGEPAASSLAWGEAGIGQAQGIGTIEHRLKSVQELAAEKRRHGADRKEKFALFG